jgi:uncharacterized membrane protein/protein-disulfide isomerase
MKAYARVIIVVLSAVALAASLGSLYVHYQLLHDPTYSSVCDVNETVNCSAVYQSSYATIRGVPVAAGGAIWSGLVLLLAAWGMSSADRVRASVTAGYVFVLSVIGLAAVFYWGYASFFILGKMCWLCTAVYVSVIGIFLVSSSATDISVAALPGRLAPDLRTALTQPATAVLAVVWLAGSTGLVAFFKGSDLQPPPQAPAAAAAAAAPVETLDAAQLVEWHAWLDKQPRLTEMAPAANVKVLLVKFNDYQCPSCRMTWALYQQSIDKFTAMYPGVFTFETRDYPLEMECGAGNAGHAGACEGAVAVRLAKAAGRGPQMEAWLYQNQDQMSRERIKEVLREVTGVEDFDAKYATVLADVRKDVQIGQKLGVTGTPTFFLNGIKLPIVRVSHLEAAITYELQKAGVPTAQGTL